MSRIDATQGGAFDPGTPSQLDSLRDHPSPGMTIVAPKTGKDGRGAHGMADERNRYWFVAAVFRQPGDLAATIAELRSGNFAARQLLVVANHKADDPRKAVGGRGSEHVTVVTARSDGAIEIGAGLNVLPGLRALLEAMGASGPAPERRDGPGGREGERQSQVYVQLRQDVADGAFVLIASVANPEEQLQGARVLLRGNCECVLTHEIAAPGS
jgi:hypothetical protein